MNTFFFCLRLTVEWSSRQGEFIGHPHACPPPTHEGCAVHPKPLTTCPAPKVGSTVSRLGGTGCDSLFPSVTSYASLRLFPSVTSYASLRFPSYGSSSMSYNSMLIPFRVGKLHLILANPFASFPLQSLSRHSGKLHHYHELVRLPTILGGIPEFRN